MQKKMRGFTLIEMVIVIVLTGIIVAVASKIIAEGANVYLTAKDTVSADWQGRLAIERMVRDIRLVNAGGISTATATQFTFTDINGNSVSYTLSGTSLMLNTQILADGISSLAFAYYDKTGTTTAVLASIRYIKITLTITQNNANYSLSTAVYPRNLS